MGGKKKGINRIGLENTKHLFYPPLCPGKQGEKLCRETQRLKDVLLQEIILSFAA